MINCSVSELAKTQIASKMESSNHYLKFMYDIVGCGCVNDGVINLALVKEVDENRDLKITSNHFTFYIEKQYEVYYENELILTYNSSYQCFQLKSPNQYINPRMKLIIID